MKLGLGWMVLSIAALGARLASAAPATSDLDARKAAAATAAALFQQGLEDMQAGRTAEGCSKLAESVATIPDSGAKGALAECYTAVGRLSESWALWRDLASSAPSAELRDDAAKNAAALDKRLARVVIRVGGAVPPGLVVTLNDKPVSAASTEQHRVTAGSLTVVAESPEIERWSRTFTASEGATLEVDIHTVTARRWLQHRRRGRLIGLSIAVAGTAALGVGAAYGRSAYSSANSAESSCGGDTDHCQSAGYVAAQAHLSDARHAATISSWAVGTGLAVATTGVILYLVYRDPRRAESATAWRAAPMADAQTVGLALSRSLP